VHPDRILRNSTVRPGDRLVLTKPLGTGALVAAMKKDRLDAAGFDALVTCMTTLNDCGTRLHEFGATAATDITGFGLTGHALEMAQGSNVRLTIDTTALPLLPEAVQLCGEGFTCGGTKSNASFTEGGILYADGLGPDMIGLLNDPQTSGGLLIAVPEARLADLTAFLGDSGALAAAVVGEAAEFPPEGPWLDFTA
jgi:selenide,water dikinase